MRRIGYLVAALVMTGATWAQAQVAVPDLVPGGVRIMDSRFPIVPLGSAVPANPAALQWGAPSRISVAGLQGDKNDVNDGNADSYHGTYVGLRWIRPQVALAAEALDFFVDFPGAPAPHLEKKQSSLALSFTTPDSLAWGISSSSLSTKTISPPGGAIDTLDSQSWTFGLSWRLGENFFIGGGYGKDEDDFTGVFTGSGRRAHNMVGLGLRGGGNLIWHLEVDSFHRDDYDVVGPQPAGYDLNVVTAEGILGNWLLSVSAHDASALVVNDTVSGYVIDIGYAPLTGLTVTWRFEHDVHKQGATQLSTEEANTLLISYGF